LQQTMMITSCWLRRWPADPHLRTMLRECLKKAARYTDENSEVVLAFESLIQNNIFRFGDTRAGLGLR